MNQKNKPTSETAKAVTTPAETQTENQTTNLTNLEVELGRDVAALQNETVTERFEPQDKVKANKSQQLGDDFEMQPGFNAIGSELGVDPKSLYTKSLQAKRKPAIYSTLRTLLTGLGLLMFVLLSAVSIAYNISEFENPEFAGREMVKDISEVIYPDLPEPISQLQRSRPRDHSPNSPLPPPPQVIEQIEQRRELKREVSLAARFAGLSFEFALVAGALTLLAYLVYRHTDWPFVKNKLLLAFLIVLVSVVISLGFWLLFRNDSRIPRALRGHRDVIRERVFRRQEPSFQAVERIDMSPNN